MEKKYPVWINKINNSELLFLGKYIPTLYKFGIIKPLVIPVFNNYNHELVGFLILIPSSFCLSEKLCHFCIGHELGYVINGDFVGVDIFFKKINTSIEKECKADATAVNVSEIQAKECVTLLYDIYKNSYTTTIKMIPTLSKKWNTDEKIEKVVKNICKYEKDLQI